MQRYVREVLKFGHWTLKTDVVGGPLRRSRTSRELNKMVTGMRREKSIGLALQNNNLISMCITLFWPCLFLAVVARRRETPFHIMGWPEQQNTISFFFELRKSPLESISIKSSLAEKWTRGIIKGRRCCTCILIMDRSSARSPENASVAQWKTLSLSRPVYFSSFI